MMFLLFSIINILIGSLALSKATDTPNLHVEKLTHDAFQSIPHNDYESLAIQLIPYIHAASNTTRKGYLCTTFLKWSSANIEKLVNNANVSNTFCDWAIIVYNPEKASLQEMYEYLSIRVDRPFEIIIAPTKLTAYHIYEDLCEDYMKNVNSLYYRDKLLSQNISKSTCDFIYDTYPTPYNHMLYSKSTLWLLLLNIIRKYEYVWLLDDDLSLEEIDFEALAPIHQCAFARPPLVSQPLINVPTQFYKYLYRGSWTDQSVLASTVGFIEIQAPLMQAEFFEWFLVAFVVPLYPAMHILGADWGIDELFCTAAKQYNRVLYPSMNNNEECVVIVSKMQLLHENKNEIARSIGIESKRQLNFGLMKVVHRYFGSFAHNGLQHRVNPFNNDTQYFPVYQLRDDCSYK